jgi:hypothetical protein
MSTGKSRPRKEGGDWGGPRAAGRFDALMTMTAEKSNRHLASETSALVRLDSSDIEKMFPTKPDKERLIRILEIIKSPIDPNEKMRRLIVSIDELAGTIRRLLEHFL